MRKYEVTITGKTPLLMHWDNVDWADEMARWSADPKNKKVSKAGDDRSPAFRWIGYTYNNGEYVCMPSENIMRSIMEGGAMVPVPGGKSGKTFKAQTQSGIVCLDSDWKLIVGGKPIEMARINPLINETDFQKHREAVVALGFELFVKRAKVGMNKHVRVRPKFNEWSCSGVLIVQDEQITDQVLQDVLTYAGTYKGLGDWRPGSKTPGPFGMFSASIKRI